MTAPTLYAALLHAVAGDGARPLVTYVGPQGRTELSVRTLQNGVAKAAGLLRDGLDVQPGDVVALLLPAHWQTAIWLGACAATGAVAAVLPESLDDATVVLATEEALPAALTADGNSAREVLRVTLHPFGLPSGTALPPGVQEAALEVRAHGDVFTPFQAPAPTDPVLRLGGKTWTNGELMTEASRLAREVGLITGGRLLTTRPLSTSDLDAALALLAAPLAADAATIIASQDVPGESPTAHLN